MKKIVVFCLLTFLFTNSNFGQLTRTYTNADFLFNEGKELYNQNKYAASYRNFEAFLQETEPTQAGQIEEAEFYLAANAYKMGQENAAEMLENHILQYPYTPFYDQANAMQGMISYDKKRYKLALKSFDLTKEKHLGDEDRTDFLFSKGYASIGTANYTQASNIFKELKNINSPYQIPATYYYAYSEYALKNYKIALPEFLNLENNPSYSDIIPYYIVQIYYSQKEYDKLNERAEKLLAKYPNNKNNSEIFRIQGEIAYKKQEYAKAIGYLKNYEKLVQKVLRSDMYLLGLSYYQQKDYINTVKYLSRATTEKDEMTENAYMHLGNAYVKLEDINNARLAFEASLRTNFNKIVREEALFNYALTSYQTTTAFGESIKAFEQFLTEFPRSRNCDKAYDYLASVYMFTKNYQAAYQSILKIKKPSVQLIETKQYLLYQLGTESFTLNKMEEAIKFFSLSLQSSMIGKYSAENLFWRADAYYRTNKSELCIIDLLAFFDNKYAMSSANKITANYALAYGYFSQKDYTEALTWFLKYIEEESNSKVVSFSDALNRIGDCYFNGRDFTNAEVYYQKAATASPNTADYAIFQGAYVSGLQKKYDDKISKLEDLISNYPKSEYSDDALYEIGRSYLTMQNDAKAIETYDRLLKAYPTSDLARKSALEIAMINFNRNNFDQAIVSYKNVIAKYPGSEESFTALESLETVYIELNDIPAYLAYTKTLGGSIRVATASREDSLSYIATEKQYMMANYAKAIVGMQTYLNKFCAGGRYCTTAQYYLADSYYKIDDKENALKSYQALLSINGNQYTEEAITRCAEITFDKKDYAIAHKYFIELEGLAQSPDKRYAGKLGILRCSYFLNDHQSTINIATELINDQQASESLKIESRYNRAKAYLAIKQSSLATEDLILLSMNTRTENGAEAKYLLANLYFEQNKPSDAENEIMDYAKKNTPHQFWLARSFVLLADIYIKQNNDFQAKQYLLSLKNNYTIEDEIQNLIKDRLDKITLREQQTIIN